MHLSDSHLCGNPVGNAGALTSNQVNPIYPTSQVHRRRRHRRVGCVPDHDLRRTGWHGRLLEHPGRHRRRPDLEHGLDRRRHLARWLDDPRASDQHQGNARHREPSGHDHRRSGQRTGDHGDREWTPPYDDQRSPDHQRLQPGRRRRHVSEQSQPDDHQLHLSAEPVELRRRRNPLHGQYCHARWVSVHPERRISRWGRLHQRRLIRDHHRMPVQREHGRIRGRRDLGRQRWKPDVPRFQFQDQLDPAAVPRGGRHLDRIRRHRRPDRQLLLRKHARPDLGRLHRRRGQHPRE